MIQKKVWLFLFLVVSLLLACSSDQEETVMPQPTEKAVRHAVFFADGLPSHYEVSRNDLNFPVKLSRRSDSTDVLIVNLTYKTNPGSIFVVPEKVWFDRYQTTTDIPISYNPSRIVDDKYDTVTVYIADTAFVTCSHESSYTCVAGHHRMDYALTCSYAGRFIDTEEREYARFNFTLGVDVDSVRFVVTPANRDSTALADGIIKGTVAAALVTESGSAEIDMPDESGDYAIVAVAFHQGEAMNSCRSTFTYKSAQEVKEAWTEVGKGVYNYNVEPLGNGWQSAYKGKHAATLYQSSKDSTRFKIAPWASPTGEGMLLEWHADNSLTVDGADAGEDYIWNGTNYGHMYFSDMRTYRADPETFGSYYDPETQTFNLYGCYWFGKKWLGGVKETFVMTTIQTNNTQTEQ